MSLNWNLGKIKDWKEKCREKNGDLTVRANTLIWITMDVGMGSITAKNCEKFFTRVTIVEAILGSKIKKHIPPVMDGDKIVEKSRIEDVFLTPQDIHDHIGLSTNADNETDREFEKKIMKHLCERAARELKLWKKVNAVLPEAAVK